MTHAHFIKTIIVNHTCTYRYNTLPFRACSCVPDAKMTNDESEREKKNQRPLDKKQKIEDGTITSTATTIDGAAYKKSLYAARDDVDKLLIEKACGT